MAQCNTFHVTQGRVRLPQTWSCGASERMHRLDEKRRVTDGEDVAEFASYLVDDAKVRLLQVFSGNSVRQPFGRHTKARRLAESLTRLKRRAVSPA